MRKITIDTSNWDMTVTHDDGTPHTFHGRNATIIADTILKMGVAVDAAKASGKDSANVAVTQIQLETLRACLPDILPDILAMIVACDINANHNNNGSLDKLDAARRSISVVKAAMAREELRVEHDRLSKRLEEIEATLRIKE